MLFDGDCSFCTTSATWIAERLARGSDRSAHVVPWQRTDLPALGVTPERARTEVLWVEPDGAVRGGAAAVASWLRYRGGPYGLLGRGMDLPVVRSLAAVAYRVVAANRHRLPGGTPACALPADPATR